MILQRLLSTIAGCVSVRVKIALRGQRSSPSRFANRIHTALNRIPGERYPVLQCRGVLKGLRMRVDWNLHRSFTYGSWEPEVVATIQKYVKPGMTVLDIGAQSGFYSLLCSRLVGPQGQVIAFEPLPANFRMLEENIRLNGLRNVTAREEAVAERSGSMRFDFPHHEPTLVAGPVLAGESQDVLTVRGISLDDWFREAAAPVHLLKMDVEGAELDVLQGASSMLNACHPDMVIELHNMEKQSGPRPAVMLIEALGYEISWLGEIGSTAHILARWAPSRSRQNAATPAESSPEQRGTKQEPAV